MKIGSFSSLRKLLGMGDKQQVTGEQVIEHVRQGLVRMNPPEDGFESRDQRYRRVDKIVPPFPLPHVSRASLRRIKDPIAPPVTCPFCGGPVCLDSNDAIYRGKRYGEWPYVYMCEGSCDAYVGLHPHTDIPLGTLADRQTRSSRKDAKELFFAWLDAMQWGKKDRNIAYAKLAEVMQIPIKECHFAMFDQKRCDLAIAHLGNMIAEALRDQQERREPFNDDIPF